jgi:hypothetical protein
MSSHSDPVDDTCILAPDANETETFVEVEDKKWTDEELMDNARPGRRAATTKMDFMVEEDVAAEKEVSRKHFGRYHGKKEKKMKVEWV